MAFATGPKYRDTPNTRYHLQAFRHLYVLAVEPRLILPRDLDTGRLCYAHIQVIDLKGAVQEMKAPCMIPELETLKEVRINDPRYWPIVFQRDKNWNQLEIFLNYTWCVDIKQRAGCLSYLDDPCGFLTLLAQSLTLDKTNVWSASAENIHLFSNDEKLRSFLKHYLSIEDKNGVCADCLLISVRRRGRSPYLRRRCSCRPQGPGQRDMLQALSMITYECLVRDIMRALPVFTTFLKIIKAMKTDPTAYHMWQLWQVKLLLSQIESHYRRSLDEMKVDGQEPPEPLISNEYSISIKQKVSNTFDGWELKIEPYLRKYLGLPSSRKVNHCEGHLKKVLSSFIVYFDLTRSSVKFDSDSELLVMLGLDGNLTPEAVSKIGELLR